MPRGDGFELLGAIAIGLAIVYLVRRQGDPSTIVIPPNEPLATPAQLTHYSTEGTADAQRY